MSKLARIARTVHEVTCTFSMGEGGVINHQCAPDCRIAALGNGSPADGISKVYAAEIQVGLQRENRQRRMSRKKRRGWA